ncbi:MAG: CpsD/CapB family tyrosine-protein kinase [Phycisphaerae bacterium]|jgi:capsular exopolysaccharide synthesis family protein|nr:CpsD/CapB family tyrosine-protein kinase [Phycisphaerae bacterium]
MTQTTAQAIPNGQPAKATLSPKARDVFSSLWASVFYSGKVTGKAVLLCSAVRQEGASTTACALALAGSLPAGADRVALVDFNLRDPMLHRILKLKPGPGVSEIITESLDPASAAQRVSSGLDVYVAGKGAGRSLDVLKSHSVREFFKMLEEGYDYIIVDTASVNHYPDAQILAATIPDVILVARAEKTPREAVGQAKKRLEAGGGKIAGMVMNLRTYPIPRFLYKRV